MTYITMFDAVTVGNIPHDAEAVAGYVNGYANFDELVRAFPHAHHLSITNFADGVADFLDCEHGDAVIDQCAPWVEDMLKRGVNRPGVYAAESYWTSGGLYHRLEPYGDKIRRWIADWTFHEHIPEGYDACQWSGGQTLDISACVDGFFGDTLAPPDPHHYRWFFNSEFALPFYGKVNERKTVEEYDGARKHPVKYAVYLRRNLEPRLKELAERVAHVALYDEKGKKRDKPEWDKNYRGFRYQQLLARSRGKQVVK